MKNILVILCVIGFFSVLNAKNVKSTPLGSEEKNMKETLALFYAEDVNFTTSPKLIITPSIHIKTYFKLKSLVVLQEKEGVANMVARIDVNALESIYIAFNIDTPAKYVVIAESVDGNYYTDSYTVDIPFRTCGRQHMLERMQYDKFFNAHLKRSISYESNITNINFMIVNSMNGDKVGKESLGITKIRIEADNKTVLTLHLSEYLNKNPYFDIDLPNIVKDAEIKIFCTDTQSSKEYEYKDNLGLRRKIVNPWKR